MENNRLLKKFNTCFWYFLYSLPLIVLIALFVGYLFAFKGVGNQFKVDDDNFLLVVYEGYSTNVFDVSLIQINNLFDGSCLPVLTNGFNSVFESIGFDMSNNLSVFIILLFSWFVQMMFLHILIDLFVCIPRLFHNFMERWF